eukprot:m.191286 g.191286  ORF g.191286 m.191286 type:complete len:561 (+) comp18301_c0_seq1:273-1955(+)
MVSIQPAVIAAVVCLTLLGYMGTISWVHNSRSVGGKQHRDTAYILDLESRLALALEDVAKYKSEASSTRCTTTPPVQPPPPPPCPAPKPCNCPACPKSDDASEGHADKKASSKPQRRHLYQRYMAASPVDRWHWGRIPIVGHEHPYGFGSSAEGAVVLGPHAGVADGDLSSCQYLDVLFQHQEMGRCLMVVDQDKGWHHSELPCARPHCGDTQGEGFTPPFSLSYILNHSDPAGPKPARIEIPRERVLKWLPDVRDSNLLPFLNNRKAAEKAAQALLGKAEKDDSGPETLLVMTANKGHMGLLLNFFCSLQAEDISVPRHFIVAPTKELADQLTDAGLTAFYHPGLGQFTDKPSESYGDETFTKMMMLKQFSVYLALLCGYDVLFQDVDLTWRKDPVPALREQAKFFHVQFMDDGARNFLNSPFFVNSGFYYIRGGDMDTFKYWDHVTMSMFGDANQRVVEKILFLHVQRNGLRVHVLHPEKWTSGMHLQEKSKPQTVQQQLELSTVLHFCWTKNITVKMAKMRVHRAVFLRDEKCFFDIQDCDLSKGKQWRDSVCVPSQ